MPVDARRAAFDWTFDEGGAAGVFEARTAAAAPESAVDADDAPDEDVLPEFAEDA
jgi:hypothetical protein